MPNPANYCGKCKQYHPLEMECDPVICSLQKQFEELYKDVGDPRAERKHIIRLQKEIAELQTEVARLRQEADERVAAAIERTSAVWRKRLARKETP